MTVGDVSAEELVVEGEPYRLDRYLRDHLPGLGRKEAMRLLAEGRVTSDGKTRRKDYVPAPGERLSIARPSDSAHPEPALSLPLVFVQEHFVIANKPAGMPSVAIPGRTTGTAAGALLAQFPEMLGVGYGPRDGGLVQRLDTYTSGALLAARTEAGFRALRALIEGDALDKRYLALVTQREIPDAGVIDTPLGPSPTTKKRVAVFAPGTRGAHAATSSFVTLLRGRRLALVEVRISAAYRHQVRAHLASIGAPLLGDTLYGGEAFTSSPRFALHASFLAGRLALFGTSAVEFSVTVPLADDLAALARDDGLDLGASNFFSTP